MEYCTLANFDFLVPYGTFAEHDRLARHKKLTKCCNLTVVKKVVCEAEFIQEKDVRRFDKLCQVLERGDFLDYIKDELLEDLIKNKVISVDATATTPKSFQITVQTEEKVPFEFLENVCRTVADAIWSWEKKKYKLSEDKKHKFFRCVYYSDDIPIEYSIEDKFLQTRNLVYYEEAVKSGDFWEHVQNKHIKVLVDKNIVGVSIDVREDFSFKVTAWIKNLNAFIEDCARLSGSNFDKNNLAIYLHAIPSWIAEALKYLC